MAFAMPPWSQYSQQDESELKEVRTPIDMEESSSIPNMAAVLALPKNPDKGGGPPLPDPASHLPISRPSAGGGGLLVKRGMPRPSFWGCTESDVITLPISR